MARHGRPRPHSNGWKPFQRCADAPIFLSILSMMMLVSSVVAQTPTSEPKLEVAAVVSPAVFAPNEKMNWACQVAQWVDHEDKSLEFHYRFVQVGRNPQIVMTGQRDIKVDSRGNTESWTLVDRAPQVPGVYEFQGSLTLPKRRVWSRLRDTRPPLSEIKQTFLVTAAKDTSVPPDSTSWQTIGKIQPADGTLSIRRWLPQGTVRLIPGLRTTSGDLRKGKHAEERVSLLESKNVFQATLPILAVGYPHLVTIRYPNGQNASLRIDLGSGDDQASAVVSMEMPRRSQPSQSFPTPPRWLEQTLIYFPTGNDRLWISNPNSSETLAFDSIEVRAGPPRFDLRTDSERPTDHTWMDVSDVDWTGILTSGHASPSDQVSHTSIQLQRMWTAVDHLSQHAALQACRGIVIDPSTTDLPTQATPWLLPILKNFGIPTLLVAGENPMTAASAIEFSKRYSSADSIKGFSFPTLDPDSFQQVADAIPDRLCFRGQSDVAGKVSWIQETNPTSSTVLDTLTQSDPNHLVLRGNLREPQIHPKRWRLIRNHFQFEFPESSQPESTQRSTPIPGSDPNDQTLTAKLIQLEGQSWLVLSNRAPWKSNLQITSTNGQAIQWNPSPLQDLLSGFKTANTSQRDLDHESWQVPACEQVILETRDPVAASELTWTTSIVGGEPALSTIKRSITTVVERIGILSHPNASGKLHNGSFEQVGEMGLVGWLHAQYPPKCVTVDGETAADGDQSVCLSAGSSQNTQVWIVSETIAPPESSRLAVSMACRAAPQEKATAHELRVSVEATQNGMPVRWASEVKVPTSDQWQPRRIVLEIDQLVGTNLESMRLTIDSLTAGKVWIDDVQLHDNFPTAKERSELQSQAFLAVQGLCHGHLTPSARLLSSPLAIQLLATSSSVKPTSESTWTSKPLWIATPKDDPTQDPQTTSEDTSDDKDPSVANRVKSWIPEPLRF